MKNINQILFIHLWEHFLRLWHKTRNHRILIESVTTLWPCLSVGRSVCQDFLKWREVTLPCFYTCFLGILALNEPAQYTGNKTNLTKSWMDIFQFLIHYNTQVTEQTILKTKSWIDVFNSFIRDKLSCFSFSELVSYHVLFVKLV